MKGKTVEEVQRERGRKLDRLLKIQEKNLPPTSPSRRTARGKEADLNPRHLEDVNRLLEELARSSR
jgi:hypothetical protein